MTFNISSVSWSQKKIVSNAVFPKEVGEIQQVANY